MAKKVTGIIKLQIPAGKATPAHIGPALGQHSVNIMGFCKEFKKPQSRQGLLFRLLLLFIGPLLHLYYQTPPAAVLLKKAAGIDKASGKPNMEKVAKVTKQQIQEIAELKMPDLNAANLEAAMSMVEGTARSMGIVVE